MKRKVRDFSLEIKEITEKGAFAGYGSVYDVIDFYNEKIAPGAFAESLRSWESKGRLPPVLWQHDWRSPVGPFTKMVEDTKGLYVEGKLLVDDVEKAAEARALMKANAISGLSVGIDVVVDEFDRDSGIITLKQCDLWEVSIVTFPANEAAQVEAVKSICGAGKLPTVRDFEDFLREAGFSKSHAAAVATHGLGRLLREAEGQKSDADFLVEGLLKLSKLGPITIEEIFS